MVPALAIGAPENEAAIPRAARHLEGPNPSRLAQAAALPITPTTAGGWNLETELNVGKVSLKDFKDFFSIIFSKINDTSTGMHEILF